MELSVSDTLQNLMRAFSGETQARARYEYAAAAAETQGFSVLSRLFTYTANQEKEHAELLWKLLSAVGCAEVAAPGDFPVDPEGDMLCLLKRAAEHEFSEAERVYPSFADTARQEGFPEIESSFRALGTIERLHGERFERFAGWLESGTLFQGEPGSVWICQHCGYVFTGEEPPAICPVCSHVQGGFLRLELSPFE